MASNRSIFSRISRFIEKEIWTISTKDKHPVFSFLVRQCKIILIAARGFSEGKIQLRAAALTFYTILSIVPILAMFFAIAQGFGLGDYLENVIIERFEFQQEIIDKLLEFVDKYLKRFDGGLITIISLLILFWSVLNVFSNIESSFNIIWQVKKSRMASRKFTDYLAILVIAPVFLVLASSFTISQLPSISGSIPFLHYFDTLLRILANVLSYTLIWFVFTIIYIIIPNTKVKFGPAFVAGIFAGTAFQLLQWGYVHFQSLLSGYSAVYGTFAALPVFMIWLELSWLIVLVGAEISFAYQNATHYEQEAQVMSVSARQRRALTLLAARSIVRNFVDGKPPMKAAEIAAQHNIPVRLVREVLYDLLNAGIINETLTSDVREVAYQPSTDPARISIGYVMESLDHCGQHPALDTDIADLKSLNAMLESLYDGFKRSSSNRLLKDL